MPAKKKRMSKGARLDRTGGRVEKENTPMWRVESSLPGWDAAMEKVDRVLPGRHERFKDFVKGVKEDLMFLADKGVNPNIVFNIIYSDVWVGKFEDTAEKARQAEMRNLSSARYWSRISKNMERTGKLLNGFMLSGPYHMWSSFYAEETSRKKKHQFARICRDLRSAAASVMKALTTIEELGLDKGECTMGYGRDGPNFLKASRKGRQKSGPGKKFDWGEAALGLSIYFRARTGQPYLERIARLLYFAGYEDFYGVLPGGDQPEEREPRSSQQEMDKIRRRIHELKNDDGVMYAVCARLNDYEMAHERRPHLTYGDMRNLIERVFGRHRR